MPADAVEDSECPFSRRDARERGAQVEKRAKKHSTGAETQRIETAWYSSSTGAHKTAGSSGRGWLLTEIGCAACLSERRCETEDQLQGDPIASCETAQRNRDRQLSTGLSVSWYVVYLNHSALSTKAKVLLIVLPTEASSNTDSKPTPCHQSEATRETSHRCDRWSWGDLRHQSTPAFSRVSWPLRHRVLSLRQRAWVALTLRRPHRFLVGAFTAAKSANRNAFQIVTAPYVYLCPEWLSSHFSR